jgi:dTDP-4-amino-4,6-dideoxygalactose transaminase
LPGVGATPHSALACFSTHPVKAMTTGEGGMVTTARPEFANAMRRFRSHGMIRDPAAFQNQALAFDRAEPNPWYYEMPTIGYNYRIPDVLCALGLTQLKKLDGFWHRRTAIAGQYEKLLAPLAPIIKPVHTAAVAQGWHLYAVLIDFARLGRSRRSVMAGLREAGIGTQVHYIPVHRQPYYARRYGNLDLSGADAYYECCLSIPMFPGMSDVDVRHVAASLERLLHA